MGKVDFLSFAPCAIHSRGNGVGAAVRERVTPKSNDALLNAFAL